MKIEALNRRKESSQNQKLNKAYNKMDGLINALNKKEIPNADQSAISNNIKTINTFLGTEKELISIFQLTFCHFLAKL